MSKPQTIAINTEAPDIDISNMTREQAVAAVGEQAVAAVEAENCDFTGALMDECDPCVEFAASVGCEDKDGNRVTLSAYYYPTQAELDDVGDDLSNIDWQIVRYEVV